MSKWWSGTLKFFYGTNLDLQAPSLLGEFGSFERDVWGCWNLEEISSFTGAIFCFFLGNAVIPSQTRVVLLV